jgi:hypothetical protein
LNLRMCAASPAARSFQSSHESGQRVRKSDSARKIGST